MQLVEFVNNIGDSLEQGDVVVLGQRQETLATARPYQLTPEVDLTERSYDTRVCGVVSEVRVELRLDGETAGEEAAAPAPEEAAADKPAEKRRRGSKGANRSAEQQSPTPPQPRLVSAEELDQIDRSRIESGQIGLMVTQGVCAYCKVDADIEPIEIGDLLTTSTTRGHAQKVTDMGQAVGAIIGKALGALAEGKGKIPVVITLQ